jgi:hypothetical protein
MLVRRPNGNRANVDSLLGAQARDNQKSALRAGHFLQRCKRNFDLQAWHHWFKRHARWAEPAEELLTDFNDGVSGVVLTATGAAL